MKYILVYLAVPAAAAFLVQSILCRKIKKGLLRYGALLFPVIYSGVGGITLLTQSDGMFGGLGVIAAVLWFAGACCAALGCGMAWLLFAIRKR